MKNLLSMIFGLLLVATGACDNVVIAQTKPAGNTISGSVFADANGDGVWQPTEKPIAGVTITLNGTTTATTDAAGHYSFANLSPGLYQVAETVPAGDKLTTPGLYVVNVTATNVIGQKNFGNTGAVAANTTTQPTTSPVSTTLPAGVPVYYADSVAGSDANDGSAGHPWKTARAISNAAVVLASGETFPAPVTGLSFNSLTAAWVGSYDPAKPAILSGEYLTQWNSASTGCTLANVTLDSPDGKGFAGNVRGSNISLLNVNFKNLSEGLDLIGDATAPVASPTITGGAQIGEVSGRCYYFLNVTNLTWTGGTFGPASEQSPVRASSPGINGGIITGVTVDQSKSINPIACFAMHAMSNVTFSNCKAIGAEFSFDTAGAGVGDKIIGCTVTGLTTVNTKVHLGINATQCKFVGGNYSNPTGECISVACLSGSANVIDGGTMASNVHGVHFYNAADTVIKNVTLIAPVGTPIIDGLNVAANDGGGNKVVPVVSILTGDVGVYRQTGSAPLTSVVTTRSTAGLDTTITATVTNTSAAPVGPLVLTGLTATFSAQPTGTMQSRGDVGTAATDPKFYPSYFAPLGCVTANDGKVGLSIYSPSEAGRQSTFNAAFSGQTGLPNPLPIEFHTDRTLAPGQSCTVTLVVRQTADLTPPGLLAGYKATLPAPQFVADTRPVVQMASVDPSWVTATDPFGFNGPNRRFDTTDGTQAFCGWVGPQAKKAGCQSVIFWALQGWPTIAADGAYPPDFDVFPAPIAANIPALIAGLKSYGVGAGLCASGFGADSSSTYLGRYSNAMAMGFTGGFYIDVFGSDFKSTELIPLIRKTVGPQTQIWCEYLSDTMIPFAGRYGELSQNGVLFLTPQQFQHLQYLGMQTLLIQRDSTPFPPGVNKLYQDAGIPVGN